MFSNINKNYALIIFVSLMVSITTNAGDMEDKRTFVELPSEIEMQLLINMRDHVGALDDMLHAVRDDEFDKAQSIAEMRLGWSSFIRDENYEIAKHLPKPMKVMAEQMYNAGSNFVVIARNLAVEENTDNYDKLIGALSNLTATCRSCHESYRIR